jgi:hypothetical protein
MYFEFICLVLSLKYVCVIYGKSLNRCTYEQVCIEVEEGIWLACNYSLTTIFIMVTCSLSF